MFCPKCGANNPDNATFCAGCGTPLSAQRQVVPTPVTPKPQKSRRSSGLPIVICIIAAVVVVLALAVFAISKIFFGTHSFRGEIGFSNDGALITASVSDDEITLIFSDRNEQGSVTVNVPVKSVEVGETASVYTFEGLTWDDAKARGTARNGYNDGRDQQPDLELSGQITIPNSAIKGGAAGKWGIEVEIDNIGSYYSYDEGETVSEGWSIWAQVDEDEESVQIYYPQYAPEIELDGSDGEYEVSYDGDVLGEINVMPE